MQDRLTLIKLIKNSCAHSRKSHRRSPLLCVYLCVCVYACVCVCLCSFSLCPLSPLSVSPLGLFGLRCRRIMCFPSNKGIISLCLSVSHSPQTHTHKHMHPPPSFFYFFFCFSYPRLSNTHICDEKEKGRKLRQQQQHQQRGERGE